LALYIFKKKDKNNGSDGGGWAPLPPH